MEISLLINSTQNIRIVVEQFHQLGPVNIVRQANDGRHQVEHRHEVTIQLFIVGGNMAKLFNFIAEMLHQITVFIAVIIILSLLVTINCALV